MPSLRTHVAVVLTTVSVVVSGLSQALPSRAADSQPDRVSSSYTASTTSVTNPERGWFHYSETHETPEGRAPLDVQQLTRWRQWEGVTLVYRIHYLEAYRGTDTLPQAVLDSVAADLTAARSAGVKLVLRFAYTSVDDDDAPAARVVGHVRQLAPVLNANSDVVAALQAGFVGRWGEWYYTQNFVADAGRPWAVDAAHWSDRDAVLDALVTNVTPDIPLQVRYPALGQRPATIRAGGRIGLHDDCFLASADDFGTFPTPEDAAWLESRSRTAPVGGETCSPAGDRSSWASASADLARFHWTFLNRDYHPDVLGSWGGAALEEVRQRLGYRLRLVTASFPASSVVAGRPTSVSLTLRNDGWAAPVSPRPVFLLLVTTQGETRVPVPLDVRTLAPGRDVTVTVDFDAPTKPGGYGLQLALPDRSTALRSRPEYSVQLANAGTWLPATGSNDLRRVLDVTAPLQASSAAALPVSSLSPVTSTNGWGPMEQNTSNGGTSLGDGRTLSLRGRTYANGLGVHASSTLEYVLPAGFETFAADVGIDDETRGRGSAVFAVYVDGRLRLKTPVLTGRSAAFPVSVPVAGAARLRLVVSDAGDGPAYDHADWAGARLLPAG